jgi:hypothetical protein
MPEARHALGAAIEVLTAQALALDRMFFRAAMEATAGRKPHRHMRKALKAQQRCRLTFKILLALRATAGDERQFSDSSEQTIGWTKTPVTTMPYAGETPPAPGRGRRLARHRRPSARWSAERRAHQALAIRTWQPWRTSTGPRTQDGKARSAGNALKHGNRSQASIERRREDRRILARSTCNIALGKRLLGTVLSPGLSAEALRAKAGALAKGDRHNKIGCPRLVSHRIGIGRRGPALIPSRLQIPGESRSRRHPPPAGFRDSRDDDGGSRHEEDDIIEQQGRQGR